MKNTTLGLLTLSAAMLLASCGGSSATSSTAASSAAASSSEETTSAAASSSSEAASSSEETTSTATSVESSSEEEDDGLRDITIKVTVTGDVVVSDENTLYMGTSLGSTTSSWQVYAFEKDSTVTDKQVYVKSFEDVEVGSYSYNFYVCDKEGVNMWNTKYLNTEGDTTDNPRKLLVEEDGDIAISASFLDQPSTSGPSLTVSINITNYTELGLTAWPQLVYTDSAGAAVYLDKGYTQGEDGETWTNVLTGFTSGTYTCHVSLWNAASDGSWPEYALYHAADKGEFSFEFTASATLTITGEIALASENALGTFTYAAA
ncbi:MAG: hypothetical protein K6B65_01560 [Bacilli bacterium]|nr:hypothetical protein [Bacilli bacterium]